MGGDTANVGTVSSSMWAGLGYGLTSVPSRLESRTWPVSAGGAVRSYFRSTIPPCEAEPEAEAGDEAEADGAVKMIHQA